MAVVSLYVSPGAVFAFDASTVVSLDGGNTVYRDIEVRPVRNSGALGDINRVPDSIQDRWRRETLVVQGINLL